MEKRERCPDTLVADAGYAEETAVNRITERDIEPLISVQRELKPRPYDFRPAPEREPPRAITAPWRGEMIEKLKSDPAKAEYKGGRWADAQRGVVLRGAVPRGCGPFARSLPRPLISIPPMPLKSP